MASPQKEDGFVPIALPILDALIGIRVPGECRKIFDMIIRQTWGYNKTWDRISLSQYIKKTNLKKSNVQRSIKRLLNMNMIERRETKKGSEYRVQKNYDLWKNGDSILKPEGLKTDSPDNSPKNAEGGLNTDNAGDSKLITKGDSILRHTDNYIKDNTTKEIKNINISANEIPFQAIAEDYMKYWGSIIFWEGAKAKSFCKHVTARWNEGWRLQDFQIVHAAKAADFLNPNNPKMRKYFRSSTLYLLCHFADYHAEGVDMLKNRKNNKFENLPEFARKNALLFQKLLEEKKNV